MAGLALRRIARQGAVLARDGVPRRDVGARPYRRPRLRSPGSACTWSGPGAAATADPGPGANVVTLHPAADGLRIALEVGLPPLMRAARVVLAQCQDRDQFADAFEEIGRTLPGSEAGCAIVGLAWAASRRALPPIDDHVGYLAVEAVLLGALVAEVAPHARAKFSCGAVTAQDLAERLMRGVCGGAPLPRRLAIARDLAGSGGLAADVIERVAGASHDPIKVGAAGLAWERLVDGVRDDRVEDEVRRQRTNVGKAMLRRRGLGDVAAEVGRHRVDGVDVRVVPIDERSAVRHDPMIENAAARLDHAQRLGSLEPDERLIVLRVLVDGESYREAAAALGISDKTVKIRYERAMRKLGARREL